MYRSAWTILAIAVAATGATTACGVSGDCHVTGTCGPFDGESSGSSSTSSTGGGGGAAPGCVPSTNNGPVASSCGIFVSSTKGSDKNEGSLAKPVQTFAKAIELAKGNSIYACGETFDEAVDISSGVTIYGALDCQKGWAYDASKPTKAAPSTSGAALTIASPSGEVEISDVMFTALDGVKAGESSIGAIVHDSVKVSLARVQITAGAGVTGESGSVPSYTFPTQVDLNGNGASGESGGSRMPCTCAGTSVQTIGGRGGDAPAPTAGNLGLPDLGGGQPGTPGVCAVSGAGHDGNPAPPISSASGASSIGKLTAAGWQPSAGSDAADGSPGQGGGGGASNATGGGGGGGCGGCGGAGAKGAKGGGASIALLISNATVSLNESRLTAHDAGDGGTGVAGQPGQTIFGFNGNGANGACQGGNGGTGGDGGASGGGAGGVSAAILFKGKKPSLTKTTSGHGSAGKKGVGGDSGNNDGVPGQSADTLEAP